MLTFNDSYAISTTNTSATAAQQLTNTLMWDATVVITDTTPAPFDFVYLSGNSVTATGHGAQTGLKVALSTTGALPTGLSATTYWLIVIDANTLQFGSSLGNALAGTAVVLSGAGSPTNTATPSALAGTLVVQKSNDVPVSPSGTHGWFTLTTPTTAATQSVSATTLNYYDVASGYHYMRFLMTLSAGQATAGIKINGKGQ